VAKIKTANGIPPAFLSRKPADGGFSGKKVASKGKTTQPDGMPNAADKKAPPRKAPPTAKKAGTPAFLRRGK
jgi:hypothetical protein